MVVAFKSSRTNARANHVEFQLLSYNAECGAAQGRTEKVMRRVRQLRAHAVTADEYFRSVYGLQSSLSAEAHALVSSWP
jgi:hypothetical protein